MRMNSRTTNEPFKPKEGHQNLNFVPDVWFVVSGKHG